MNVNLTVRKLRAELEDADEKYQEVQRVSADIDITHAYHIHTGVKCFNPYSVEFLKI